MDTNGITVGPGVTIGLYEADREILRALKGATGVAMARLVHLAIVALSIEVDKGKLARLQATVRAWDTSRTER